MRIRDIEKVIRDKEKPCVLVFACASIGPRLCGDAWQWSTDDGAQDAPEMEHWTRVFVDSELDAIEIRNLAKEAWRELAESTEASLACYNQIETI